MIFLDSNIPMYLVGAPHPNKERARRHLEEAIASGEPLVTSCEVFQEILHRYAAIDRKEAIGPAFDLLRGVVDEVYPIEMADVGRAREILVPSPAVSARDALHLAVMERRGVTRILSFDAGFDGMPGIERIPR